MDYSSNAALKNEYSTNEDKRKRKNICTTMMAKLTKVWNTKVKLPIEFDQKSWTCYDKNTSLFRSYAIFLGRVKMSILIDD